MSSISVAMAVYNGGQYIQKQLDSILTQLEPQDELVISYDKSTDNTWAILLEYQQKYSQIKLLQNKTPGVVGNFNNAIQNSQGDYIFISDQDDIWAENKRESVVNTFQKAGADMVIHNGVHIDGNDKVISKPFFEMYRIGDGKWKNIIKSRYSGCCMAFTQKMKQKIMPMPANIDAYDRWIGTVGEFMGKIAYDSDVLLYHRLHGNNVTPTSHRSVSVIFKSRIQLVYELQKRIKREKKA